MDSVLHQLIERGRGFAALLLDMVMPLHMYGLFLNGNGKIDTRVKARFLARYTVNLNCMELYTV